MATPRMFLPVALAALLGTGCAHRGMPDPDPTVAAGPPGRRSRGSFPS